MTFFISPFSLPNFLSLYIFNSLLSLFIYISPCIFLCIKFLASSFLFFCCNIYSVTSPLVCGPWRQLCLKVCAQYPSCIRYNHQDHSDSTPQDYPASLTASATHYPLHLSLPLPLTTPCLSHCLCHSLYQYLSHWLCLSVPSLCSMPLPRTVTLPNSLCLCPTLSYCLFYSLSPAFLVASLLTSPYITVPLSAPLSPYLLLLLPLTSLPTSCRTCSLPLTLPHLRPLPIHLPLILLLPLFLHYPWLSSCCTSSPTVYCAGTFPPDMTISYAFLPKIFLTYKFPLKKTISHYQD